MHKLSSFFLLLMMALLRFSPIFGSASEVDLMTVFLRYNGGRGVGYDSGYTTLSALWVPCTYKKVRLFADVRAHYTETNDWSGNAGMGLRVPIRAISSYIGINGFFDYRSIEDHSFEQVGLGLELLNERWGLSVNGYLPIVKKDQRVINKLFDHYIGDYFIREKVFVRSLKGVDLQGVLNLAKTKNHAYYLYAGPYYYFDTQTRLCGLRGAVSAEWQYCRISGGLSYDHVFKLRGQWEFSISYPFGGRGTRGNRKLVPNSIFLQPVQRSELIVFKPYYRWKWNY